MDIFDKAQLQGLLNENGSDCVSFYMPTDRGGSFIRQNSLRLKQLIELAEQRLLEMDRPQREIEAVLQPVRSLLADEDFWVHTGDGLAVFCSARTLKTYRLPEVFTEMVGVDRRFHLAPMLQFVSGNKPYYILALSQNDVRLLKANRMGAEAEEVSGLPGSVAEAVWYKETEKQLQQRNAPGGGSFHGQGEDTRQPNVNLLEFTRAVDKAVCSHLKHSELPLVLVATEPTLGMYRKVNGYRGLINEAVSENPDNLNAHQLQQKTWLLVERLAEKPLKIAKSRFQELAGRRPDRVSTDVAEILKASRQGRVETLMVGHGGSAVGESEGFGERLGEPAGSSVYSDLTEAAVSETLRNSGQVFFLPMADFPAVSTVAAILRY